MEGALERQWRRDAAWAMAVIVAAALFSLEGARHAREAIGRMGAEPAPGVGLALGLLVFILHYTPLLVLAGGFLLLYAGAIAAGVEIFARGPERPPTWNLWDVARTAAAAYLAANLIALLVGVVLGAQADEPSVMVANAYFLHLALLVLTMGFVARTGGTQRGLGFTLRGLLGNLVHGVVGYVAILPVFCAAYVAVTLAAALLRYEPEPNPLVPVLREADAWARWPIILLVAVIGPFTEEVFFRGYLYQAVRRRLSVAPAVIVSGVLFALIHLSLITFLPILLLGMAMAYLFERTRSLVACTTFHVVHNTILILFYLPG